jgi:hypothetical protein
MSQDFAIDGSVAIDLYQNAPLVTDPGEGIGRDALLQTVRRVDWRFLLPSPKLDHVAFLGDDDQHMVQALRWFSNSVSLLDLGWSFPSAQAPRFDVVILRSSRLADLEKANAVLEPGGVLSWEIERRFGWRCVLQCLRRAAGKPPRGRMGPCLLQHFQSHLAQQKFEEIRFHWHRPDFKNALEIIPLSDDAALDFAIGNHRGKLGGAARRWIARLLRRTGLLRAFVPTVSVLARKPFVPPTPLNWSSGGTA